ncbi:serine hydrolase domain-containing protein [Halomonas organivorans]|uniref:CubicO group peptidase (Beta-lactamase class C family) n=1 Tax=Halomonas organivorans TaxID=257772 RepID=A0A7W5G499_9GAMM|nr:serine hydrolase [Halomonas organivorans]MBB3139924.1 CubicO group peptidase (beta-lactamase class C family) [Halomonas organivorans]
MITRRAFTRLALAGLVSPLSGTITATAFAQQGLSLDQALNRLDQLHSIQVQLGDRLIIAEAPRGPGLDALANIKSCSKSLVALLLGSCIDTGEIPSVASRLIDVAPAIVPPNATEGVDDLTLEDLVTLRAGLESTSGKRYGAWVASSDWLDDALTQPMVARPGGRMIYSTGTTHVLGAALAEASGQSLLELARGRLGAPMGFDIPPWVRDPQGYYLGGNEMALTPRAMLSLARLIRDGGHFDGQQVIPADWIQASLEPRAHSPYSGMGYGYGWFISDSGYVLARGYGGQVIAAHRERGLAVAITSDPSRPARSAGYFGDLMRLLDGPVLRLADEALAG